MSVRPELRFSGISSESFRKGVIRNKGSENEIKKGAVKKRVFYSPLKMPGGIPAFFKGILIGLALRVVEIQGNVVEKGRFFCRQGQYFRRCKKLSQRFYTSAFIGSFCFSADFVTAGGGIFRPFADVDGMVADPLQIFGDHQDIKNLFLSCLTV